MGSPQNKLFKYIATKSKNLKKNNLIGRKIESRRLSEGDRTSIEKESLKLIQHVSESSRIETDMSGSTSFVQSSENGNTGEFRASMTRSSLSDCTDFSELNVGTLVNHQSLKASTGPPPHKMSNHSK